DDRPLGLRHHLLADHDDVLCLETDPRPLDGIADQGGEIVPGLHHGEPRNRDHGDGHGLSPNARSAATASWPAWAGVCITVSVTSTRRPRPRTREAQRASAPSSTN